MYNQNSGYGQALLNMVANRVPTFGRVFIVMDPDDTDEENYNRMQDVFPPDPNGKVRLFTSLSDAYDATESNNNDVILLDGNSTHVLTEMLTVSNNRVHFIGMDGGGHLTAQGAKVQIGVTGVATDLAPVLVTGVRCSFRNIKFINASTTNETLYGFIDNGEGTVIENCSMIKTLGLDDSNHASFWMAGDSLSMRNCVIGQSNTPNTAAGFGILIDGKTGGATDGTVKENFIENCYINMSVGGSVQATSCFIKVADASALNFGNTINGLIGNNFIPSGGTIMTDAVLGAAQTSGNLLLANCVFSGSTGIGSASGQGVYSAASGVAPVAAGGLSTATTD